ncbi:MAG: DNA cytosine methyltransferase [Lachnospiraceae bacterium]|nr:DNA cytosine methyltransferase [Lachnospiraceae bacterium]
MKLGSLFDGSGGFPLGGIIAGMTPVWSSEIEPFPIRVTEKRLPQMKHYGDVSKISGADLEPVDVITFGSPCQDMSVAGKRAGLNGARSGLFFQAVRIIKEMRAKYGKPRYAVWENVRGALSSAGGEDFRRVLEELCRVKDDAADVPRPKKWQSAGLIWGNGYSVAWRVLDAQYWGVPQRRKRVYLVADFDGNSAGKILFESEGVSGHSEKMQAAWQDFARCAQGGAGETGAGAVIRQGRMVMFDNHSAGAKYCGPYRSASPTLNADHPHFAVYDNHPRDGRYTGPLDVSPSRNTQLGTEGNNAPLVCVPTSPETLYCMSKLHHFTHATPNQADTLVATDYKSPPVVNVDWRVRMITPLECARLQGFPDWWTDGLTDENPSDEEVRKWQGIFDEYCDINSKKRKTASQVRKWLMTEPTDAAKYKMWGNGVALPCVVFVLAGIAWEVNNANKQAGA